MVTEPGLPAKGQRRRRMLLLAVAAFILAAVWPLMWSDYDGYEPSPLPSTSPTVRPTSPIPTSRTTRPPAATSTVVRTSTTTTVLLTGQDAIESTLRGLKRGRILFNVPVTMTVARKERIEVRVARSPTVPLSPSLRGSGPPIEEVLPKVSTFMSVDLRGQDFAIESLSPTEQPVSSDDFAQWEWDVTPKASGTKSLHIVVNVRVPLPDGRSEERIGVPVYDREVAVRANPGYNFREFLRNWQWIVGTLIALAGVILGILNFRKSKSNE